MYDNMTKTFTIDGPLTGQVRQDLAGEVAEVAADLRLWERPGEDAIRTLASCVEALAKATAAEIRHANDWRRADAADRGEVAQAHADAGLNHLRRVVLHSAEARRRIDSEYLAAIQHRTKLAQLLVDGGTVPSAESVSDLLADLDHLLSAVIELKQDINKVDWSQVDSAEGKPWGLSDPAAPMIGLVRSCAECGCCIGTYENFRQQWLCSRCSNGWVCRTKIADFVIQAFPAVLELIK